MKPSTTGQPGREPLWAAHQTRSAAVRTPEILETCLETCDEVLLHQGQAPNTGLEDGSTFPQTRSSLDDADHTYADPAGLPGDWDSYAGYAELNHFFLEPTFIRRQPGSRLAEWGHALPNPFQDPRLIKGRLSWVGALLGLAGVWGAFHLLQKPQDPVVEMVLPSRQLLTAVLQQNYAEKLLAASAALEAGELLTETQRPGIIRHTVEAGDTLWLLTRRYQVDAAAIAIPNQITAATELEAGQELLIPGESGLIVLVNPGDTLEGIARRYRVSLGDIIRATQLTNPNWLQIGQPLLVPGDLRELLRAERGLGVEDQAQIGESTDADPTQPAIYRIQSGDTIEGIARQFGVSEPDLLALNQPLNPTLLQIGQELRIPVVEPIAPVAQAEDPPQDLGLVEAAPPDIKPKDREAEPPRPIVDVTISEARIHRIEAGDAIEILARRYGVSELAILDANPGVNPRLLQLGQDLRIPGTFEQVLPSASQGATQQSAALQPADDQPDPDQATAPPTEPAATASPEPDLSPEDAPLRPQSHRIQAGDTIEVLARRYGVSERAILEANPSLSPRLLQLGQDLRIPGTEEGGAEPITNPEAGGEVPQTLIHQIQAGDTIEVLARRYQVSEQAILAANQPINPRLLQLGQPIRIPGATAEAEVLLVDDGATPRIHTVRSGDTIERIAAIYGVTQAGIIQLNRLSNPGWLRVGQELEIPSLAVVAAEPEPTPSPSPAAVATPEPTPIPDPTPEAILEPALDPVPELVETPDPVDLAAPNAEAEDLSLEPDPLPAVQGPAVEAQADPIETPSAELDPDQPDAAPTPAMLPDPEPPVTAADFKQEPDPVNPVEGATHTVRAGETLRVIAARYGVSQQAIAQANLMPNPNVLQAGQQLRIPGANQVLPAPEAPPQAASTGRFVWPVEGRVTSGFGWRRGRIHAGVDIPGPVGSPIVAVMEGEVIFAAFGRDGYGNRVDIRHPNGLVTRYAHGHQIYVSAGQWVQQGQVIMSRGNTGWSTGPHLHFEVRPGGGAAVDPMPYLR